MVMFKRQRKQKLSLVRQISVFSLNSMWPECALQKMPLAVCVRHKKKTTKQKSFWIGK